MDNLQIFKNPEFGEIRTIKENEKILFCGNDVAKALGYKRPADAITAHCKGSVFCRVPTKGGTQEMKFIPEGDIYRLAAKSELPEAEKFESWIFDEVLPSIRKHGGYIAGEENLTDDELLAKAFVVAQNKIAEREKRIAKLETANSALTVENEIMRPKSEYFDELVDRNLLTNFRDTAKQLEVKEKSFIGFLLDKKYVYRDKRGKLQPYAQHVSAGLFEIKECFNDKTAWSGTQTLITPKGRETFRLLCIPEKPKKEFNL